MKQVLSVIVSMLVTFALSPLVLAVGWQPEQIIDPNTGAVGTEGSCARVPNSVRTVCVYTKTTGTPRIDLYMVYSDNGGVTWQGFSRITSDAGDEYGPFLAADPARNRVWVLYSKWHNDQAGAGNDLVISYFPANNMWAWSSPVCILCDGKSHWDASLLVLQNGHLLALETLEGLADTGIPAKIRSIRSTDGGATWGTPQVIIDESGEESFPVAWQNPNGAIMLMYRDTAHGGGIAISRVWSEDNGQTWIAHGVFYNSPNHDYFTFVGPQTAWSIIVLASLWTANTLVVHHWQSNDGGINWVGPFRTSDSSGTDAQFSTGCRGPIFTYGRPYTSEFVAKRYDSSDVCR